MFCAKEHACMNNKRRASLLALLVLVAIGARAQSLVYAISYRETSASRQAHPQPPFFRATSAEKLLAVRAHAKTDILALSAAKRQSTVLFSDQGPSFEILPEGDPAMVVRAGKLYAIGVEREWRMGPSPGVFASDPAFYEISLDGSNKFRKLAAVPGEHASGHLFLHSSGSKLGYATYVNDKYTVFIYEVASGRLLQNWNASGFFRKYCADCLDQRRGWLNDDRLFFNLQLGDDDSISETSHNVPGTYLSSEDGKDLGSMPPKTGCAVETGYARDESMAPTLLGTGLNGDLYFVDFLRQTGPRPKKSPASTTFLVIADPRAGTQRQILLEGRAGKTPFQLWLSATSVAFVEKRFIQYREENHVWQKSLETGAEEEMLTLPANVPGSTEPEKTLYVIGWMEGR
jgi:hypothetical protein